KIRKRQVRLSTADMFFHAFKKFLVLGEHFLSLDQLSPAGVPHLTHTLSNLQGAGSYEIEYFWRATVNKFCAQLDREFSGAVWMGPYTPSHAIAGLNHGHIDARFSERSRSRQPRGPCSDNQNINCVSHLLSMCERNDGERQNETALSVRWH